MSSTQDYPATEVPTREAPARKYTGYFFFALFSTLYLLPFMRILLHWSDEGTLVYGAVRILHGQVFARDFFEVIGPGTFYWLALFFKLFGVTFLATRICLFVSSLGTGLLMYFLSRRVCRGYRVLPCLLLAGASLGALWPAISHHVDSNFFALLSVAAIVLWQDKHKGSLLLAAGILAGATTCFLQPKGILLLVALLLWLWIQRQRGPASLSPLVLVAGGYTSVIGLVLIYFWSQHALWDLIDSNFLWPARHYHAVNAVPYAQDIFHSYWLHWPAPTGGFHWTAGFSAVLIMPFLFIAALPALLPLLAVWRRWRGRTAVRREILLYWFCGWALWLGEIHRTDIWHLVFGSPLLIILCIHYLEENRAKLAGIALQLLAISAACLAAFSLLVVLSAHPEASRVGSVATIKNDPVIPLLERRVTPGEEIFTYPYCPIYYFLSATKNPTRYSILMYDYNTPSQFEEVIRVLEQRRVKYVVWNPGFLREDRIPPGGPIVEPYLESHYNVVWAGDGVRLMERKGEE